MEKKVDVKELQIGMYVARLDRPWLETPFLFQGFTLRNNNDIESVRKYCKYVFVDDTKAEGTDPARLELAAEANATAPVSEPQAKIPTPPPLAAIPGMPGQVIAYQDTIDYSEELKHARKVKDSLDSAVDALVSDVKVGSKINTPAVGEAVEDMVRSVVRNPDALLWLTKLRTVDSYAYDHAIDTSVLASMFGRHLGLPVSSLVELGLAGLLFDVGKLKMPPQLLKKPGKLTEEEFEEVRRHVDYSIEILSNSKGVPPRVIEAVRHHHERHDGRGYPAGISGAKIPIFARIIAIVDCFDAITSARPFRGAISAHNAIREMYAWRGTEFQAEFYEQFIQCLGVYPTGTIVELSTGEVGIVVAQNRTRRLRPRIMMVLDENKVALERNSILNLADELPGPGGRALEIVSSHDTGAFGIDPQQYFN